MAFENMNAVSGPDVREYRQRLGLTIKQFWEPVGCTLARGHAYETGKTAIPTTVRKLIYLHYTVGVPLDFESEEFKRFMKQFMVTTTTTEVKQMIDELNDRLHLAD